MRTDLSNPPPYNGWQITGVVCLFFIFLSGSLCNGFLSYVLLKNRRAIHSNVNLRLTTFLNLADAITPTFLMFFQLAKLFSGRYGLGYWGCQLEGALISFGVDWSLFAVIIIAAERYCVIVRDFRRGFSFWKWPVAVAFVAGLVLGLFPLMGSDAPYVVQPSGLYCMDDIDNPVASVSRPTQILYLTLFPTLLVVIGGTYFKIYKTVTETLRRTRRNMATSSSGNTRVQEKPATDAAGPVGATSSHYGPDTPYTSFAAIGSSSDKEHASYNGSMPLGPIGSSNPHLNTSSAALTGGPQTAVAPQSTAAPPTGVPTSSARNRKAAAKTANLTARAEQQAFRTSLAITACFFLMLVPYLINLAFVTAGYDMPIAFDAVVAFSGTSNLLSDALIVYNLDPRAQKMVKEQLASLFGRTLVLLIALVVGFVCLAQLLSSSPDLPLVRQPAHSEARTNGTAQPLEVLVSVMAESMADYRRFLKRNPGAASLNISSVRFVMRPVVCKSERGGANAEYTFDCEVVYESLWRKTDIIWNRLERAYDYYFKVDSDVIINWQFFQDIVEHYRYAPERLFLGRLSYINSQRYFMAGPFYGTNYVQNFTRYSNAEDVDFSDNVRTSDARAIDLQPYIYGREYEHRYHESCEWLVCHKECKEGGSARCTLARSLVNASEARVFRDAFGRRGRWSFFD
ncbi:hypothetical protein RI367_007906 [Sorochytrium milnesiophthora]